VSRCTRTSAMAQAQIRSAKVKTWPPVISSSLSAASRGRQSAPRPRGRWLSENRAGAMLAEGRTRPAHRLPPAPSAHLRSKPAVWSRLVSTCAARNKLVKLLVITKASIVVARPAPPWKSAPSFGSGWPTFHWHCK